MVPESIEREVVVAAPIQRVWEVVTQPEHIGTWFGDAGAEVDLRPGGQLVCSWTEHGTVRAIIETVEAPTHFSFRWAGPLAEEPSDGNSTLVEFFLSPAGDGTLLRVVERGFRDLAMPSDGQATYAEENTEGWASELDELRAYVIQLDA